ncbi:MAG: hypothetical protein FJY98_02310 [Candidatus Liptonbacteria bacterium]|nr:hypothetical protein [Candidatus Liptonbacteria bacterium]
MLIKKIFGGNNEFIRNNPCRVVVIDEKGEVRNPDAPFDLDCLSHLVPNPGDLVEIEYERGKNANTLASWLLPGEAQILVSNRDAGGKTMTFEVKRRLFFFHHHESDTKLGERIGKQVAHFTLIVRSLSEGKDSEIFEALLQGYKPKTNKEG